MPALRTTVNARLHLMPAVAGAYDLAGPPPDSSRVSRNRNS